MYFLTFQPGHMLNVYLTLIESQPIHANKRYGMKQSLLYSFVNVRNE